MRTLTKLRLRLMLLYIGSFVMSVAPLLIVVIVNRHEYVRNTADAVKLSLACVMVLAFIMFKVTGKLKMPKRIVFLFITFIMCYFIQTLLDDLLLLSGMALLGEFIDFAGFQWAIRATKEKIAIEKSSDASASKVEKIFEKYVGSGRV